MQAISTRPFSVCYTGSDIQCTCRMRSGDDIKIPPERRGFGDVWLIPRASLTLSAFWREISNTQSHCRKQSLVAKLEILGYSSMMTQHVLAHKLVISSQLPKSSLEFLMKPKESAKCLQIFVSGGVWAQDCLV